MDNQSIPDLCPPCMKALLPFFVRARDFDTKNPQVAYLLKSYATQMGIEELGKLEGDNKEMGTTFLMRLMDHLEEEKADETKSNDKGKEVLMRTALLMFKRADDRERSEQADKACIAMFMTSSLLMEALKQFGEVDPDIKEKQTYARQTAARIKRALDSGTAYVSPNAPLEDDAGAGGGEAFMGEEPAQQQQQHQPAHPSVAGLDIPPPPPVHDDPTVHVEPAEPALPVPPPPPASAAMDLDQLVAQLSSHSPTSPAEPADEARAEAEMDDMEARLNSLRGSTPQTGNLPAAPPAGNFNPYAPTPDAAAPTPAPTPAVDVSHFVRTIDGLEMQVMALKRDLAAAQVQIDGNNQQLGKYQQAVQLLQGQLAAAQQSQGASGGAAGAAILQPRFGFEPTLDDLCEAQKYGKYIISALQFKDTTNARENLMKALAKVNGQPMPTF